MPSDIEVEAEDDEARFANGRLAMLLSSRRSTPTFRTITDFEWDIAPLPPFQKKAGILHSDAYCMTAASDRKDAGVEVRRVRARARGAADRVEDGPHRPLADRGLEVRRISRSNPAAEPVAGVPGRDPDDPAGADDLDLAGDRDATAGVLENGFYLSQPAADVAKELDRVTRPLFARGESG